MRANIVIYSMYICIMENYQLKAMTTTTTTITTLAMANSITIGIFA